MERDVREGRAEEGASHGKAAGAAAAAEPDAEKGAAALAGRAGEGLGGATAGGGPGDAVPESEGAPAETGSGKDAGQVFEERLPFATLRVRARTLGGDWCLLLEGGARPHVGCAVLAVPRPSLADGESTSATASVINATGHKDDALCRLLAERVSARRNAVVACAGGFHLDDISPGQIEQLLAAAARLAERI